MLEKYIIIFFMTIFHAELYFCDKFRVKCFQIMKIIVF
jgi:hypothetical protein